MTGSYLPFDKGSNVLGLSVGPVLPLTLEVLAVVLGSGRFTAPNLHLLAQAPQRARWDVTS